MKRGGVYRTAARRGLAFRVGARGAHARCFVNNQAGQILAKTAISLRLSPDTLARWKATGPGSQTRMAQVLRPSV
ncbi:MAG: BrnA antitoxin family protein [Pseudomonadota bacterium]